MKKLVRMAATFAAMATLFVGCGGDDETEGAEGAKPAMPTIVLEGGDIDKPQEVTPTMQVKVGVTAPGRVAKFEITIDSPALSAEVLEGLDLALKMDLVAPATPEMGEGLAGLGFPVGDKAKDAEALAFDLSTFIPFIAMIHPQSADHKFQLTVTDAHAQSVTKTLLFRVTGVTTATYNNDADLWANTASVSVKSGELTDDVKVEYRRKDAAVWQKAVMTPEVDGAFKATLAPAWSDAAAHASGAKLYTVDEAQGVFAGCTYEYRVLVKGAEVTTATGSFTTPAGELIPGGDMESWKETVTEGWAGPVTLYVPTRADGSAFWGNGANAFTPTLCVPEELADKSKGAKLSGNAMGTIFAAGNLFTGVFEMAGMAGYARFGEVYEFKARPRALRVRYKASINTITMLNPSEDFTNPAEAKVGAIDPARIFVCVTDWTDRHSVYSGLGVKVTDINAFDPEQSLTTAEGAVLAYASKTITESVGEWTELTMPLVWSDKSAKPQVSTTEAVRYSLVISAAASAYGDYLCGCIENELYVDSFEWIY